MAKRKRIGRPPKPAKDRKSIHHTFRMRGEMRDRLRDAAAVTRRSISEEIEYRLNQSFEKEQMAREAVKAVIDYFNEQEIAKSAFKKTEDDSK